MQLVHSGTALPFLTVHFLYLILLDHAYQEILPPVVCQRNRLQLFLLLHLLPVQFLFQLFSSEFLFRPVSPNDHEGLQELNLVFIFPSSSKLTLWLSINLASSRVLWPSEVSVDGGSEHQTKILLLSFFISSPCLLRIRTPDQILEGSCVYRHIAV